MIRWPSQRPPQLTLALVLVSFTLIAAYFLLAAFGLGFLAGEVRHRAPWLYIESEDHAATVGFNIYVSLLCFQATLACLLLRPSGRWRFTALLGSFAINIILALIASIAIAWVLFELGQTFRPVGMPVDIATSFIRSIANFKP